MEDTSFTFEPLPPSFILKEAFGFLDKLEFMMISCGKFTIRRFTKRTIERQNIPSQDDKTWWEDRGVATVRGRRGFKWSTWFCDSGSSRGIFHGSTRKHVLTPRVTAFFRHRIILLAFMSPQRRTKAVARCQPAEKRKKRTSMPSCWSHSAILSIIRNPVCFLTTQEISNCNETQKRKSLQNAISHKLNLTRKYGEEILNICKVKIFNILRQKQKLKWWYIIFNL